MLRVPRPDGHAPPPRTPRSRPAAFTPHQTPPAPRPGLQSRPGGVCAWQAGGGFAGEHPPQRQFGTSKPPRANRNLLPCYMEQHKNLSSLCFFRSDILTLITIYNKASHLQKLADKALLIKLSLLKIFSFILQQYLRDIMFIPFHKFLKYFSSKTITNLFYIWLKRVKKHN